MKIKKSLSYAIDLLEEHEDCVIELSWSERMHLTALLLLEGGDESHEAIYEAPFFDELPKLMANFMLSNTVDDQTKLVAKLVAGAKGYYENMIDKLLDDARFFYEQDQREGE